MHSLWNILNQGGPVQWLLLAISIVALAMVIWKFLQFLQGGLLTRSRELNAGEIRVAALGESMTTTHVLVMQMIGVIRHLQSDSACRPESWDDEIQVIASQQLRPYEKGIRTLEGIATLSPLLGLFGTVVGMIVAFSKLEAAQSQISPALLAGGIWQALLTTAGGLAIAIPVKAALVFFEAHLERARHVLEHAATRLANSLSSEDITGRSVQVSDAELLSAEQKGH